MVISSWHVFNDAELQSQKPEPDCQEYPLVADLRRPTFKTARSKPAGQDRGLNVSKVASISATGAPGIGHFLPLAKGSFLAFRLADLAS